MKVLEETLKNLQTLIQVCLLSEIYDSIPTGKISETAVWTSVFLAILHCRSNADSTKTHSSGVTYLTFFAGWENKFVLGC